MIGIEHYEHLKNRFDYNPETGNISHSRNYGSRKVGDITRCYNNYGYLRLRALGKTVLSHRLAFYVMEGHLPEQVDHINGVKDDNRWVNLRPCTNAENSKNRGLIATNTSGYRGVSLRAGYTSNWAARVMLNNKTHSKSGFKTPELANEWVVAKSKELYGEFYNENRIKEVI